MNLTNQSFFKSMVAFLMSAIIFVACKKTDTGIITQSTTPESTTEVSSPDVSVTDSNSTDLSGNRTSGALTGINLENALAPVPVTFEGYGSQATGGAGQQTVHVTNLNSSGTGSLANAMGSNRTIVFDVGGTISDFQWESSASNLTIDGTTAPSPGITLTGNNSSGNCLSFDQCSNVIVKNIRIRGNAENDAVNIIESNNIALDRLSISGAHDGNLDISEGSYNVTVQRCIIGGGASDWSGAMLLGYSPTKNISVHHNLFCTVTAGGVAERIPFIRGTDVQMTDMIVEFRNNLVWKWGRNGGTGAGFATGLDYGGTAMVINNYYYSGASASNALITDADPTDGIGGQGYFAGNVSGNSASFPGSNHAAWTIPSWAAITNQDACTAAAQVKAQAGCQPLDATDLAYINGITLPNCSGTTNLPPIVNAGTDQTITLPVSSVTLAGTASDPGGSVASYLWTKVSGTGGTITSSTAATTTVTGLTAGTYVYSLRATDNQGATATDNVTITVNPVVIINQPPVVNAGIDKTITLPVSLVTLAGTASDPDGTVASYLWTKVSGPGGTITTSAAATTTVTGLTAGTYVYSLRATDNQGATATDNVTVIVNPVVPINLAPIVNAGTDQTITLPVSSVSLTGTASDPDGTVASYLWTKVSGTGGSISTSGAATTTVTGLTAGTYVYSLRATDNQGATATDNVTVTVNPVVPINQAPVVNAGTDKTITLALVSLIGTASDPDGSIASYLWTKVSGTGGAIITPAAAITTVTGLTIGTYVFKLTVTDNQGATASDDITITRTGTTNQAPIVNAGTDQTITLPVSSVSLTGIASDPDGIIASYLWTKVSGTGGTITTSAAATTTVTGLTAGTYVYSLRVTDNQGATATDNVTVTVNSALPGGYGTLSYSQGYDVSSSINTNQGLRNSVSFTRFITGPGSFRSEVRAGDPSISGGWRSEMPYTATTQNPTEGVVEYDVYYENWGSFDGGGGSISWNPQTSGASSILMLQNYNGKFNVVRQVGSTPVYQSGTLMTCAPNTWYKMRWEFKWSSGTDGYIRLYINNVLYYSFTGKTAYGSGQKLRIGQNRWPSGSGTSMQTTSVCYYDNLKIYKK